MKLFFSCLLLLSVSCHHQQENTTNDLVQYGMKGKVKKVTTHFYDSTNIIQQEDRWIPVNEEGWKVKIVYDYNTDGNISRMETKSKLIAGDTTIYTLTTEYKFDDKGTWTGQEYDNEGKPNTRLTKEWTSNKFYKITGVKNNGRLDYTVDIWLTNSHREKAGDFKLYEGTDTLVGGYHYENTFDDNNRLVRYVQTDLKTKIVKETRYTYKNIDKAGNPLAIYAFYPNTALPSRVSIRTIDYY